MLSPASTTLRHIRSWALMALLVGCDRSSLSDGLTDTQDCSACHGTAGDPAPPRALNGATATTDLGVGAHAIHLKGSLIAGPVACTECHPYPTDLLTHPTLTTETPHYAAVTFGALATTGGVTPIWDRTTGTCSSTYCHGATQVGMEARLPPVWTRVDGTYSACTACHGFPPGGTHPQAATCESCHGAVAGPGGVIVNPSLHVNGIVDFAAATGALDFRTRGMAANASSARERSRPW